MMAISHPPVVCVTLDLPLIVYIKHLCHVSQMLAVVPLNKRLQRSARGIRDVQQYFYHHYTTVDIG
jgi:hypothetical protein